MKENLEADCMRRLQQGEADALALLMRRHYDNLYNYGCRFTKDSRLIKDCIQEVFISLWQRRETASNILSPKYYLLRAIKNKIIKTLHKNEQLITEQIDGEYNFFYEFSIEKMIIEKQISDDKARKLKRTLSLLSKRQKEIIYLKFYQHLDHGQIAELMNLSSQSVYNLLHEAIQKLRNLWYSELAH